LRGLGWMSMRTHERSLRNKFRNSFLRRIEHTNRLLERGATITDKGRKLGLGETDEQLWDALRQLRAVNVDVVTFGQYMRPTGTAFFAESSTRIDCWNVARRSRTKGVSSSTVSNFAETVIKIKQKKPSMLVECLTGDFRGDTEMAA
jgi:lipoate synthase